jgi:DNA-dependent RNA polymerase auxiliary subunit epsilon
MDFSLEDLQNMLDQVQNKKTRQKLSERNTINILEYLKKISDLVLVTDKEGKNFYTLDALDKEIYNHISIAKKMRLNELERYSLRFSQKVII